MHTIIRCILTNSRECTCHVIISDSTREFVHINDNLRFYYLEKNLIALFSDVKQYYVQLSDSYLFLKKIRQQFD